MITQQFIIVPCTMLGSPIVLRKAALLLKSSHDSHCSRIIGLKEGSVEDLPSTKKVVTHCLVDSFIGASSQQFSFDELNCLVAKLSLRLAVPLSLTLNNCYW